MNNKAEAQWLMAFVAGFFTGFVAMLARFIW